MSTEYRIVVPRYTAGKYGVVFDVCVIVAGLFGSAAAKYASADPSLKVCLLGPAEPTVEERPNREIFASHYDEGRITRLIEDQVACQILSKQSIQRYREIEQLSGIHFYTPVGCMFIGEKNGSFIQNTIQSADPLKISLVELSNQDVFNRRYTYLKLNSGECAILEDSGGGHISPRKLLQAQQKIAELQGCRIINDVACGVKAENGIHVVRTEKGEEISARRLLISTGAFTNLKDLQPLKSLVLKRTKETVGLLKIPGTEISRLSSLPDMLVIRKDTKNSSKEVGCYILPPIKYPDGNYYLKFGDLFEHDNTCETLEDMKNWYLSEGSDEIIRTHLKLVQDLIPGLQFASTSKLTCVACYTPSRLPYIDRVSPTVTVAVGGNAKCARSSDEIGRIAAHLSLAGLWDSELNPNQFRALFE